MKSNKTKSAEILEKEIRTLSATLVNLGTASNVLSSTDLNSPDGQNASKWEKFLDRTFEELVEFATGIGIDVWD